MENEKKYHHGNLREELISEGLKLLNAEGYEAFSMRKLATILNVSHTAAYRHFADKEKLLEAIYNDFSKKFYEALIDSVKDIKEPDKKMTRLGIGYVEFFVDHPEMLSISQIGSHFEEREEYLYPFNFFKEIAKKISQNSRFSKLSETEILLGLWGKVHGLACLLVTQKNSFPKMSRKKLDETISNIMNTSF